MKKLLEYYDIADLSNMKAGVRGSKAGFIRNLIMGRCSHHCYIVTLLHCYMLHVTLRISHPPHAVRPPREAVGRQLRQVPYSASTE